MNAHEQAEDVGPPILPEGTPVQMPELPLRVVVNTAQQFKAIGDPLRLRVLNIIRHQPATAKQLADQLGVSPGAMGHHLRVLQEAGLAQVVARRIQRGIVASYYTRTARIFMYDMPPEMKGSVPINLDILNQAREELAESLAHEEVNNFACVGFPHARLSRERAEVYCERLHALIEEFLNEPSDPDGEVFGLSLALFTSPPYMQAALDQPASDDDT